MEDRDMKYCKLCLVTDVKMFSMNTPSILEAYSQLVQIVVCKNYQMFICYECIYLLRKYQEFRLKCVTALNVLSSIDIDHSEITTEVLQNIDREHFNLQSNLACCNILLCNSNQQMPVPNGCLTTEKEIYKIDSEVKIEFDSPEAKFKINVCDPNHATQDDTNVSNEIVPKSNDSESDNNDFVPEIRKKRKRIPKLKISKENTAKSKTKIKQKQNTSNNDSKPIIKQKQDTSNNDSKPITKRSKKTKSKQNRQEQWDEECKNLFKDYATVVFLTPEDARNEMLLRKESKNYMMNPYKCDLCYKGFELQVPYENHLKKHSPESGSLECEYCHIRVTTKKMLYVHTSTTHKRKYICNICPYVCYSVNQATAHKNRHKGKQYECQDCGQVFSMSNSLSTHKRLKHPREVVCALCGSAFGALQGLNSHQKLAHRHDNIELVGPKCLECDVQFATETAWKRHLVLSSKHIVLNGCSECGEIFSNEAALKCHSKQHPPTKAKNKKYYNIPGFRPPAACEICNKWLATRGEYKDHMTSQHPQSNAARVIEKRETADPKLYVCEVCGMSFKMGWLLRDHHLKHTDKRPYKCRECGKGFTHRSSLCLHQRRHHSYDPASGTRRTAYQCDMCQKQFYAKGALVKHIKAHLGIRPYECSYCQKCFPHKYEVRLHVDYVHRKEPWPKRDRVKRRT